MISRGGLRRRVAVWFGLLGAGLVAVFSAVIYLSLWETTIEGLDRELSVRAEQLLGRCSVRDGQVVFDSASTDEVVLESLVDLRWAEVRAWPEGRLLFQLGPKQMAGEVRRPDPIDTTYTLRHRTAEQEGISEGVFEDFDDRVCELVAPPHGAAAGGQLMVQVRIAADVAAVEQRLESYLLPLLGIDALFVLAAFLIGRALSSRLVNPILELRAAAFHARGGARVRMPRTGRADELDDLAEVLEQSFAALESALDRQRRFTADAAHELRNPISAVTAAAEVALRRDRDAKTSEGLFQDILFESKRMGEALEALLVLARCDAGDARGGFMVLELGALVGEVIRLRRKAGSSVGVVVTGSANTNGEPALLKLLFDNLLKNAERFSPPGGQVAVRIQQHGNLISVLVIDDGPGIPCDERPHVFERFYRVDLAGCATGSAGLGLSIAKAIVELHQGWIGVLDVDHGTTIRIQLPTAKATTPSVPNGSNDLDLR